MKKLSEWKLKKTRNKLAAVAAAVLLALPLTTTPTLADTNTSTATSTAAIPAPDTSVPTTVTAATTNTTAAAQNTAAPVVDSAGNTVSPANWLTDLLGRLQLMLTFDPAQKAQFYEQHGLANLAEAQELMKENKPDNAQQALTQYSDKIAMAQQFLNQVKDPNSEAAKNLVIALSQANTNNIKVLSSLLDKLPPQAAQKLALNVIRSMEKAVNSLDEGTTIDSAAATTAATTAAAAAASTTSVTSATPATTSSTTVMNRKALEKEARQALEDFKKSLNQKEQNDQNDQSDEQEAQSGSQAQAQTQAQAQAQAQTQAQTQAQAQTQTQTQTQATPAAAVLAQVKLPAAATDTHSSENKEEMHRQTENGHDNGGNHHGK